MDSDDYTRPLRLPLTPTGALDHARLDAQARHLRREAMASLCDAFCREAVWIAKMLWQKLFELSSDLRKGEIDAVSKCQD